MKIDNTNKKEGSIILFEQAIESALEQAMSEDSNIFIMGEDVHTLRVNLLTKFGKERVKSTPISESAFLGASVTAAMAGLHPVVEIMLVDFIAVAIDGILNHAAKNYFFSGEKWNVPLVIRTSCGGGYGDGGQHEQSLWGWLAHIPGISVVVPSTPADAGTLMYSALKMDSPVIFLEHKLLANYWLDYLGLGGRTNIQVDVPEEGARGYAPKKWTAENLGKAIIRKEGKDISIISVGVGVHRSIEAANFLEKEGISAEVIDLRSIKPLDTLTIIESVEKTKNMIVVDEDYNQFGLTGEIAAICLENDLSFKYRRVATENTIPFNMKRETQTLPSTQKIIINTRELLKK